MPETVDDFMRRFGGDKTMDDREAAQFHERFVSTRPEDREFDNQAYQQGAAEYLGKLPDDEFEHAARSAVAQTPPQERKGLIEGLLGALAGGGGAGGLMGMAKMLGLGSADPNQMSEEDTARVMNYARKERPDVLQRVVQEKPWFVKAMGNPVVMGALTMAAAKLLQNQRRR